jgi:hypothetical protein
MFWIREEETVQAVKDLWLPSGNASKSAKL